MPSSELPYMTFRDQGQWRTWFDGHHGISKGIWMRLAKKSSGIMSISHAQALETALCYGWIDGKIQKLNECYWLRKFTPRTSNSIWSQINRAKALELIDRGLMQPAGMAAIEKEPEWTLGRSLRLPEECRGARRSSKRAAPKPEGVSFFQ